MLRENVLSLEQLREARGHIVPHIHRTPLLTSKTLDALTGFHVHLKAEMFQRTGSYKIRGPLNKLARLSAAEKGRGVICSSAGNHAQGVACAASIHGVKSKVVMATNATPSKIAATRGYGAEVVLHGTIWDEANSHAQELVKEHGYTYLHPFDDLELIAGQASLGLEVYEDLPDIDVAVVPIGGGGLISGVSLALKLSNPNVRVIGVESSGAPAMAESVRAGYPVTLENVGTIIDGLRVKRVGDTNLDIVSAYVDEIVTVPDEDIFKTVVWLMSFCKLVAEGAAAAPVAALLNGLVDAAAGSRVACVLSGGNVDLSQFDNSSFN